MALGYHVVQAGECHVRYKATKNPLGLYLEFLLTTEMNFWSSAVAGISTIQAFLFLQHTLFIPTSKTLCLLKQFFFISWQYVNSNITSLRWIFSDYPMYGKPSVILYHILLLNTLSIFHYMKLSCVFVYSFTVFTQM